MNTTDYITTGWQDREPALGIGTARRLASAERAVNGLATIVEKLVEDRRRKALAADDDEPYKGLAPCDVEMFGIAAVELGTQAMAMLEQVREHRYGAGAGA